MLRHGIVSGTFSISIQHATVALYSLDSDDVVNIHDIIYHTRMHILT